jgi:hypothetical protein
MPVPPPSSTRHLDVEAALGVAGLTPFHRKAIAITGVAWTFVAMEILLVGFTLPLFGSIWNLSATQGPGVLAIRPACPVAIHDS